MDINFNNFNFWNLRVYESFLRIKTTQNLLSYLVTNYIILKIFQIFTWLYKKSSKHSTLKKRLKISKNLNILHCQAKGLLPPAKRTGIFSIEFRDICLHASEISKGYLSPSNLSLRVYDIPDTLSWYQGSSEWMATKLACIWI